MINGKKVLAVIQARGGSKGIPKKNIYELSGHPLIAYTIEAGKNSAYIDRLVVSSDCPEIRQISELYGAEVPFTRPDSLSGDEVLSVDSLYHAVTETERIFQETYGYIIELPCVAPLRDRNDIDNCLEYLSNSKADSVISVVNTGEKHPIRLKRIVNDQIQDFCSEYPEPGSGSRRQDFEPCFIRNGAIYSMTRDTLLANKSRHGEDSRPFEMPEEKSLNIDGWFDLKLVKLLIENGFCSNVPKKKLRQEIKSYPKDGLPKILITAPLHFLEVLKKEVVSSKNCTLAFGADQDMVKSLLKDVDGWLCSPSPDYKIDEDLLKDCQQLKIISTPSTGSTHIDLPFCEAKGISVKSLKGSKIVEDISASSEFTFTLMLAMLRKLPFASIKAKQGVWREQEDIFRSHEFQGKQIGIIGFGRIGSNLAKYALPLGFEIHAFDLDKSKYSSDVKTYTDPLDMLPYIDILAVCVHLDASTRGMITKEWFNIMKKGSFLLNTSRGEVVVEDDLLEALQTGRLASAAVDVISDEQMGGIKNHKIVEFAKNNSSLIVTPHIAGLTYESEAKATKFALEQMMEELERC